MNGLLKKIKNQEKRVLVLKEKKKSIEWELQKLNSIDLT